jgi:uncharacterized DUF497 family protein
MWNSMARREQHKVIWDKQKALANERKHGISFELASTAFLDPLAELFSSDNHEDREDRWTLIGMTGTDVLVVVIHLYPDMGGDECVRIISARKATFKERREYESGEYSIREPEVTDEYDEQYEKAEGEWELDFSKAIRGRFRYSRFQVFIDNEILGHFHTQQRKTGIDMTDAINEVLRRHLGLPPDSPEAERR